MDAQKLLAALVEGELGDHIRSLHTQEMLAELESGDWGEEQEWAAGVATWLRENWL